MVWLDAKGQPTRYTWREQVESRLVDPDDDPPFFRRLFLERRPALVVPLAHRLLVALRRKLQSELSCFVSQRRVARALAILTLEGRAAHDVG
jgi:hypothetical protein